MDMNSLAARQSNRRIFGLSPWLLVGVSLVLGIAVFALAVRSSERERGHIIQSYFERAEALIWALEAGARTEKGYAAQGQLLQALIEETARQPGIAYMSIVDTSGRTLAHSDASQRGAVVAKSLLPGSLPSRVQEYKYQGSVDDGLYEVFRGFSPLSQEHEPGDGHRPVSGDMHGGHLGIRSDLTPNDSGEVLEKEKPTSFIFVGFDQKPLEDALATDYMNNLLSAFLVASLGFGGFISLFWANSYRESRRKLKDTQALASEVVTSLPLGLLTGDPSGNLVMSNATALSMFRTTKEAVRGKPVRDIPGLDWGSITSSLTGNKKILEREMFLTNPEGKQMPVSVSASEIRDESGLFLGHIFILRDISEIKRLQAEAQKNERLTALGNLAAGVAHEIRNPLSSIKGLATYLAQKMQPESPEEEAAKTMVQEVNRLNRVVSELLDFARPGVVKLAETDINAVVARALRLADADLKAGKISVSYTPLPDFPHVLANAERLTQALLNLFLNSVQAMEHDGELSVHIEKRLEEEFAIVVTDTGQGIPPDVLASLFTPYFTTKPSGTGLGLAIVHQIVEGHGGKMSVASEPGAGSTFTIILPLRRWEA